MAEGRIGVDEAQAEMKQLARQKVEVQARIVQADRRIGEARRAITGRVVEENKALDRQEAAKAQWDALRGKSQALRDQIAKMDLQGEEAWPEVKRLVAQRDEAEAQLATLSRAKDRLGPAQANAARNYATAEEIDRALASGEGLAPTDPLYDVVEQVADQMGLPVNEDTLGQISTMLRGSADRDMAELARFAQELPSTGNPQQLRGELSGAVRRMRAAGRGMIDATDEASYEAARGAVYEEAAVAAAHRRNMLNLHAQHGSAPSLADLEPAEMGAFRQALDAQVRLTAGLSTPQDRAAASLANAMEQWAGRTPEGAVVANPGGGQTWFHGAVGSPVNPQGQFDLERAMRTTDAFWMDTLFGPSLSADPAFSTAWVDGDPQRVQQIVLGTDPSRVRVYGPGMTSMEELAAQTQPGGTLDVGTAAQWERQAEHPGGPGYEMFRTDSVARLMDENPHLHQDVLDALDRTRMRSTAKSFREALDVQDYLAGSGSPVGFAQALQVQQDLTEGGLRAMPWDVLDDPTYLLPGPHDYLPDASLLSNAIFDPAVLPTPLRRDAYTAIRSSMQRDYDVIAFGNLAPPLIGHPLPIIHALPTNQLVMSVVDEAGQEVGSLARHLGVVERSYSGKAVDAEVKATLQRYLAAADPMLANVNSQFAAATSDVTRAAARREQAQRALDRALYNRDRSVATLQAKVEGFADAEQRYTTRAKLLSEDEARVAHLEAKAADLSTQLLSHNVEAAYAGQVGDRVERLRQTLGQSWEGFSYNREVPSLVNEILADISRSYDPVSGEGLRSFLTKFDKVNSWMKGWLTSSPGFQSRNIMGGTFNNWLAGVDVIRSGRTWGSVYFDKMAPRNLAKNLAEGNVKPWERALFDTANKGGVVRSGLFTHETGRIAGDRMSLNPLAGVAGGDKAFVLPYATRRLGEQAAEPFLRGSMHTDRFIKAVERGRFADMGIRQLDDITEENLDAFTERFLSSPVMSEINDDISKYHFDYDDLSSFERQVGRRLIPFYTWTRKNVPLQVEALFTQPGKAINRYMAVKRNLELGTEEEGVVPSYFREGAMIHLPFSGGGGDIYGTVELPFKDPFKVADITGQLTGMLNPLIKAPIEAYTARRQFFSDVPLTDQYKELPTTWLPIVPILAATAPLPFTPWDKPVRDANGTWMLRDRDAYLVGQYLPFLGQTRRLLPNEPKYEKRLWSTGISYLMGVNLRTNTPQDQESELFRRADKLEGVADDLKALGHVPETTKPPAGAPGTRPDHDACQHLDHPAASGGSPRSACTGGLTSLRPVSTVSRQKGGSRMASCRVSGCPKEGKYAARGMCWGHYHRFHRYGHPQGKPSRPSWEDRLYCRFRRPAIGCWLYGRDTGRVPRIDRPDGTRVPVKVAVWEREVGPLPPAASLQGLCLVVNCVRPDHHQVVRQSKRQAA